MANEQNEQAQDIQNEQAEQSNEQTQAESVEQANDVTVESLQAQITKLEENLKLEKLVLLMQFTKHKKRRAYST